MTTNAPTLSLLVVYPTFNCCARCIFCWPNAGMERAKQFPEVLEPRDVDVALNDAIELNIERVSITGGEPLLKWDLTLWIVEKALSYGINTTIETNLLLFDEDKLKTLLGILNKIQRETILQIAPTFLSLREAVFNKLMGFPKAYELVLRKLRKLVSISKKNKGLRVGTAVTILKSNLHEALDIGEYLLKEMQVDSIKFNPVVELGRFKKEALGEELSSEDLIRLAEVVNALDRKYPKRVSSSIPFCLTYQIGPNFCPYDKIAAILPDGRVTLCINMLREDKGVDNFVIAGNIKTQRLKDIYLNSSFFKLLRNVKQKAKFDGVCSICIFRQYCAPGCIAYAFGFYNSLSASNPMCQRLYDASAFPIELISRG